MRFYETNSVTDQGFELSTDEVATQFWQSEEGEAWLAEPDQRLDRVASGWIMRKLGGCDRDDLDEALDAIAAARPK